MTVALRPCLDCGEPCAGPRCPKHSRDHDAARRAVYDSPRWKHLRRTILREHRLERGPWCPGFEVPPHVAFDLTLDHVTPLEVGGAPYARSNLVVLCRACNSRHGTGDPG